jgi:3',5'-nucleoside bisphosphate phosphatase
VRDRADLHIHSTASDGAMTPREVVREAMRIGLGAVALVDHDTLDGLADAAAEAKACGVEFAPGVEINTDIADTEIHIIGYFIDPANSALAVGLDKLRIARLDRGAKIVDKLREIGLPITMERVIEIAGSGSVGRPHIAKAICEVGATRGMNAAFGKYLVRGAPAYVPRARMSPIEAITLITDAGGVACLAHPGKIGKDNLIDELLAAGLRAIEVYHTDHSSQVTRRFRRLANKHGLIQTGGSDSHGMKTDKPIQIGSVTVDIAVVEELRRAARR